MRRAVQEKVFVGPTECLSHIYVADLLGRDDCVRSQRILERIEKKLTQDDGCHLSENIAFRSN